MKAKTPFVVRLASWKHGEILRAGALALVALIASASVASAVPTAEQKCATAKLKTTARLAAEKIGCHSKALLKGTVVDPSCLSKAEAKFNLGFLKSEIIGGCLVSGDAGSVGAIVDDFVDDVVVALPGAPKRIFITSTSTTGNIGGLSGADAICAARASVAGLVGEFKAWLSSSTISAASRLTHSPVAYQLVDGTTVANDWGDLSDGSLDAPPDLDENGASAATFAWTATDGFGATLTYACLDWTSSASAESTVVGLSNVVTDQWTAVYPASCGGSWRLYCLEQ